MSQQNLSHLSPGQRLSAGRASAARQMPYFGVGISSLSPVDAPGLKTLGVTSSSHLLVDYEEIAKLTAQSLGTIILHEYMHIYLRHHQRYQALLQSGVAEDTEDDHELFNQASDAEINCNLRDAHCEWPSAESGFGGGGGPVYPEQFGCLPHRPAEEYFAKLKQDHKRSGGGSVKKKSGLGSGCGSGSGGNPLPGEPPASDPNGRSQAEQNLQRKNDSEQIQQAAKSKSAGSVPAGLVRAADAELAPAKVKWTQKLARSVRAAVSFFAGQGDFTFERRARVQGTLELMFGEECPVLPGEHSPRAEVVFAADTSGSVGDEQMQKMCNEAADILKNMGGARITFMSCDAKVHTLKKVRSVSEIRKGMKGGGGTAFQPVFGAIEKLKPRPNILVYATDGYAMDTQKIKQPKGIHVIWLIIEGQNSVPWGEVIDVDKE